MRLHFHILDQRVEPQPTEGALGPLPRRSPFRTRWIQLTGVILVFAEISLGLSWVNVHGTEGVIHNSPFTNAIPLSVYREFDLTTQRDPFTRVGYLRPKPLKPDDPRAHSKPKVEIKLKINSISSLGSSSIAILADGQMLEAGNTYEYRDGATSVPYKVLRVTDTSVVILYDDQELEFKMKGSDLKDFIE